MPRERVKDVDAAFNELITEALDGADRIDTTLEDYITQLRTWQEEIEYRIQAAQLDLDREGPEDD